MGDFDDANVDKDLLNQIFADEGENEGDVESILGDIDLDAAMNDDKVPSGSDLFANADDTDENEETAEEIFASLGLDVSEDSEEVVEETKEEPETSEEVAEETVDDSQEETSPEQTSVSDTDKEKTSIPTDDIVSSEAEKAMAEERINGTVTVITENTTITGSISSDGSLEVMGVITGDIECLGKVYINGKVSGSVIASEIYVNTPKLNGGLQSESVVKVGVGTVVIGDVSGTSAYIAGAVKGNIDIDGPVVIDSTAVVKGDIKAKSIQINTGAVVDGFCSLNYAGIDLEKFFDEK